jgi:hypothetical protein
VPCGALSLFSLSLSLSLFVSHVRARSLNSAFLKTPLLFIAAQAIRIGSLDLAGRFAVLAADVNLKRGCHSLAEVSLAFIVDTVAMVGPDTASQLYFQANADFIRANLAYAVEDSSSASGLCEGGLAVIEDCLRGLEKGHFLHQDLLDLQAMFCLSQARYLWLSRDQQAAAAAAAAAERACGALSVAVKCDALLLLSDMGLTAKELEHPGPVIWGAQPSSGAPGCGADAGVTRLWEAFALSKNIPRLTRYDAYSMHCTALSPCLKALHTTSVNLPLPWPPFGRIIALRLARIYGRRGFPFFAAALLHSSMGASMSLQYQFVLAMQRARLRKQALPSQQPVVIDQVADALDIGIDWDLTGELLAVYSEIQRTGKNGKGQAGRESVILEQLESSAEQRWAGWLASLPQGAVVCGITALHDGLNESLTAVAISRISAGAKPLVVELSSVSLGEELRHPIASLSMAFDDERGGKVAGIAASGLERVLSDFEEILAKSKQSMHDMATETREEQRAWWKVRLELDDDMAGLVKKLDTWMGDWR